MSRHSRKKHKKHKASRQKSAQTTDAELPSPEIKEQEPSSQVTTSNKRRRYGVKDALADLVKGLFFIALLFLLTLVVEHTTFGKQLRLMGYNLLQFQLGSRPAPVTIVDTSTLAPEEFDIDGQTGIATPREALKEMIEAVASHSPKVIGIDIDFAPDENGYIYPHDPEFFQFCLELGERHGIPVVLGVKRTLHKPSGEWLGDAKYRELAGSILVPKESRRMLRTIKLENGGGEENEGMSMSVALAEAYKNKKTSDESASTWHGRIVEWLSRAGLLEMFSEKQPAPGLSLEDFLVDFSSLESIETVGSIDPAVLRDPEQRSKFQGKIVLFGDATLDAATDTFLVPGREQPVPGVFLHGCAANTLLTEPLYEVTHRGRIVIDLALSLLVLLIIIAIRFYVGNEMSHSVIQRLEGWLTLAVVLLAIVGGALFVRSTRVMWEDFLLVVTVLIFHPSVEKHIEAAFEWFKAHFLPSKAAAVKATHD
jgi:CHASE2 domain-containing sensor protein